MDKRNNSLFMIYSAAAMELCWLQAWAEFLLMSIFKYRVSFLFTCVVFFTAALVNWRISLKNRRVISRLLIQIFSFAIILPTAIYFFLFEFNGTPATLEIGRLFLVFDKDFLEWMLLLILVVIAFTIWKRGSVIFSKPLGSDAMYNKFDLGITAFTLLLIIQALIIVRFDIALHQSVLEYRFVPFFIFGLLNIGMTLMSDKSTKQFATGFQKIGIALSFGMIALSLGLGIVLLFSSQLAETARISASMAKKVGSSFEQILIMVLKFLWRPRNVNVMQNTGGDGSRSGSYSGINQEMGIWGEIVFWGFSILIGVMILVFLFILLRLLIRRLFSHSNKPVHLRGKTSLWDMLASVLKYILLLTRKMINRFRLPVNANDYYLVLNQWGRLSGLALKPSETPSEYSHRLTGHFPVLTAEINQMINLINLEIFGKQNWTEQQKVSARTCYRQIFHPKFWPIRIRTWFWR